MNLRTFLKSALAHRRHRRLSRDALEAMQLRKFRSLVAYVHGRSPYYAGIIARSGIDPARAHPSDFPVLTKRDLLARFDEIVTDRTLSRKRLSDFLAVSRDPLDLFEKKYYVMHTSGSSGEIGLFVYSQADFSRGIAQMLRLVPAGGRRPRIAYVGATQGHFAGVTLASAGKRFPFRLLSNTETIDINRPIRAIVDRLNTFQPTVLIGYASALKILAEKQDERSLRIHPALLESGGEAIAPADRVRVERAFHAPLYNVYASTEHLYMGIGKPEYGGMVLLEDDLIFELRGDHTLVTNLFNRTLPLIRYRMDDVLVPTADPAPRLPYRMVKEVVGRAEQMPLFTNQRGEDDFISPFIFIEFHLPELRQFQVEILDRERFVFKAVAERGLDNAARAALFRAIETKLRGILSEKEMENVSFEIREVDPLPVDPKTGKFRLIVPSS